MNTQSSALRFFILAAITISSAACSDDSPTGNDQTNSASYSAIVDSHPRFLSRGAPRLFRPIDEFIRAQGGKRDLYGRSGLVPGAIAWQNHDVGMTAVVDFAGALFRRQVRDFPLAVDTPEDIIEPTFDGVIVEQVMSDGTVRVVVELSTKNALSYAVNGMKPGNDDVVFGAREYRDRRASRSNSVLLLVFRTTHPGAPMPDLIQLIHKSHPGMYLEYISFNTAADREKAERGEQEVVIVQPGLEGGSIPRGPIGALPAAEIEVM